VQPEAVLQASVLQGLLSWQSMTLPARHVPLWQESGPVQELPSSQAVPLAMLVKVHTCVASMHESFVQGLPSSQMRPPVARHAPVVQTSPVEQGFPSSQVVPLSAFTCVHPAAALQLSTVHGLPSSQAVVGPASHTPALQVSPWVQTVSSWHTVPSSALACSHPPLASQVSSVQGSLSSQTICRPALHAPP
jgi:hypothetical protein